MTFLKIVAISIVVVYCAVMIILYALQTKLIFYPGKLASDHKFKSQYSSQEISLSTGDGEHINALFFRGTGNDVILYFHGNAGDLSGWQFVAEDFIVLGYNFLIIDYRGYGKSSGVISEDGLYLDATAAFEYLIDKGFSRENIILYGRSVGSGIAVDLASKQSCKGLVLESPFSSLKKLANEKLPFFFPSLFMRYSFDNIQKINEVKCPLILIHGVNDTLIPINHSELLYRKFTGKKKMIAIPGASHNDIVEFPEYKGFLAKTLPAFF